MSIWTMRGNIVEELLNNSRKEWPAWIAMNYKKIYSLQKDLHLNRKLMFNPSSRGYYKIRKLKELINNKNKVRT